MASDGALYISGVSVNGGHIMCYGPTGILEWQFEHDRPGFPIWSNYRRIKVDSQDRVIACGQADGLGGYTDWSTVCVDRDGNLDRVLAATTWQNPVHFAFSLRGVGDGPCPTALGGLCLDILAPVRKIGTAVADVNGLAVLTATVPPATTGMVLHFQALEARGPGGASSVASNVVSTSIQ